MQLVFSGAGDQDVTTYLRRVQVEALQQGCPNDDAFRVDLVVASLEGPALRWFCDQEEEGVQEDWKTLRRAMLCHFQEVPTKPVPTTLPTPATLPVVHVIPHLTTLTAGNLAATAWSSSKSQGRAGIRIYKPARGCIQEICDAETKFDVLAWHSGSRLVPPIGISDTAPIAAANSFGLHGQVEKLVVSYVSRDNHLRAFQWRGHWVQGTLDVPLKGICTALTAECRVGIDSIVWTVSYSINGTTYLRFEEDKLNGESTLEVAERPEAMVAADPDERLLAALDKYDWDESGRSLANLSQIPKGWIPLESPMSVIAWTTGPRKILVFFKYTGDKLGYIMYDQEAPSPGWQPKIFAVQYRYMNVEKDAHKSSVSALSDLFGS
ncbi:hypothetical protein FRB96_006544 [Tulasnella sp. 330]|nr:hypothetical protein FRB96_006544 [Tulasnella sp. 330]KAG8874161.1 hypothetical protein FRB97_006109 [Tulasnella sp. 331]KAG8878636.1 hypothetical protein FRB98_006025 [Tulasnella sp. 332]